MTATPTMDMIGRPTNGKPINLAQLHAEIEQAGGVDTSAGLGFCDMCVHTYDADALAIDFPMAEHAAVDAAIAAHVALRDKTDAELSVEFQAASDPNRKQELRDQMSGLLPREQVPM